MFSLALYIPVLVSASHTIPTPSFDDPIVRDVREPKIFRLGPSVSTVHPSLSRGVKNVSQLQKSLQSATIEGSRTTVEDLTASEALGRSIATTGILRDVTDVL